MTTIQSAAWEQAVSLMLAQPHSNRTAILQAAWEAYSAQVQAQPPTPAGTAMDCGTFVRGLLDYVDKIESAAARCGVQAATRQ